MFMCAASSASAGSQNFSLDQILRDGSFGLQLPIESQVVRAYGEGCVKQPYREERFRTYFDASARLWLRCKVAANETPVQTVNEVLVSSVPLCDKKIPPRTAFRGRILGNIRIGDGFQRAVTVLGKPSRSARASLNGVDIDRYDYIGSSSEPGTIITFYARNDVIVGFSVSSPE
jgi:hypothetical protein